VCLIPSPFGARPRPGTTWIERRVMGNDSGQMVDRFEVGVVDRHGRHPGRHGRRLPESRPVAMANWDTCHHIPITTFPIWSARLWPNSILATPTSNAVRSAVSPPKAF
jgi:hypothetical protein